MFMKFRVVWDPFGFQIKGMMRRSFWMVGFIMVAEVLVVFYRVVRIVVGFMIRVMVRLVVRIMVMVSMIC